MLASSGSRNGSAIRDWSRIDKSQVQESRRSAALVLESRRSAAAACCRRSWLAVPKGYPGLGVDPCFVARNVLRAG